MDFVVRHFCQWTHFFYEGDNITETFKSVDLEVIISQFNGCYLVIVVNTVT